MNHYDLVVATGYGTPDLWKKFLLDTDTIQYIQEEMKLIQEAELKKMIIGAGSSRSVGQAQLINSLAKLNENKTGKDGPIFIYTYIPLSSEQKQADNVTILNHDPFL